MSISLLVLLALRVFALPGSHVVHEVQESLSTRWVKGHRVNPEALLPVRIGLVQNNLEVGPNHLLDISDPASPRYGKHWTSEEVIEFFRPSDEGVDAVSSWLQEQGIVREEITHSGNKAWLAFHATARQLEQLLHAEYHDYEDLQTGGVSPACERYHVPAHIGNHIDYIKPGIHPIAPLASPKYETNEIQQRQLSSSSRVAVYGGLSKSSNLKRRETHRSGNHADPKHDLTNCWASVTPACISALYSIPPAPSHACPNNSLGIFTAELQYWDQQDLDLFFEKYTDIPRGTHPIDQNIDGGVGSTKNVSAGGNETMMDLSVAYPIVHPQTITVWNEDDLHYQAWENQTYTWGFNTFLDYIDGSYCTYSAFGETGNAEGIDPTYPDPAPDGYKGNLQCGVFRPNNVFVFSYGGQEADVPIAYQKRQCNEFMKLGLQGVSLIFPSGDTGVQDFPSPVGFSGPTGCLGRKGNIFNPAWPSCPWVTIVGVTKILEKHKVTQPEAAPQDGPVYAVPGSTVGAANFTSGGGFSNIWGTADYQAAAVGKYFAEHDPDIPYYSALVHDAPNPAKVHVDKLAGDTGGLYNRVGRGYPDVAANGDQIVHYAGGEKVLDGGSSASVQVFAAIINRINEARLAAGKGPVGFVNPALYAHPEVLNDIRLGKNEGCARKGFSAVEGWDPVTGLGTPNYPKMEKFFLSLP